MKILFIGNSITLHAPCADIGWYGNYGMAASCEEKDYVHVLLSMIEQRGIKAEAMIKSVAEFERNPDAYDLEVLAPFRDFEADVIIIRIAENTDTNNLEPFARRFPELITYLLRGRAPKLFSVGSFWSNDEADGIIKAATEKKQGEYISLTSLHDDKYRAPGLFAHEGVANHPSDSGMKAIAEIIYNRMEEAGLFDLT